MIDKYIKGTEVINIKNYNMSEYMHLGILMMVSVGVASLVYIIAMLLGNQVNEKEKLSAYECGFNPYEDAREVINVKYYLVAILFIIFDLEVSYMFPWAVGLSQMTMYSYWGMLIFLIILTAGFVYEWSKGALEWD